MCQDSVQIELGCKYEDPGDHHEVGTGRESNSFKFATQVMDASKEQRYECCVADSKMDSAQKRRKVGTRMLVLIAYGGELKLTILYVPPPLTYPRLPPSSLAGIFFYLVLLF